MILSCFDVKFFTESGTPNIAIPASGQTSIPITSETVWKNEYQELINLLHDPERLC